MKKSAFAHLLPAVWLTVFTAAAMAQDIDDLRQHYKALLREKLLLEIENRFLEFQMEFASSDSSTIYLVIDSRSKKLYLKLRNKVLRECEVRALRINLQEKEELSYRMASGPLGLVAKKAYRIRGGSNGSQEEGHILYFEGGLVIHRVLEGRLVEGVCVELDEKDVKALFEALEVGSKAILLL